MKKATYPAALSLHPPAFDLLWTGLAWSPYTLQNRDNGRRPACPSMRHFLHGDASSIKRQSELTPMQFPFAEFYVRQAALQQPFNLFP